MFDLPRHVDADPVGDLDLFERVLEQPMLAVLVPRPWKLVLVEDAELHAVLQRDAVTAITGSIR